MKSLIFSGLVLGSSAYLVATQTDLLSDWTSEGNLSASKQLTERQPAAVTLDEQVKSIRDSELVKEFKANISALKTEVGQLTQALKETQIPKPDEPVLTDLPPVQEYSLPPEEALPRREIVPDPVVVSPYMPVKERSDALMDLAHRMEMKAAAY